MTKDEALRLALEAMKEIIHWYAVRDRNGVLLNFVDQNTEIKKTMKAITEVEAALEAKDEPIRWKLMPRDATNAMLKAMDECATEGYDERLPAGIASSVYMAAWDAMPEQINEFNPDWDAMAVMVEEQQRMAKRIEELEAKGEPWEQFYPEMGKPKLAYLPPTASPENACYTPPQRTWIGLTSKEFKDAINGKLTPECIAIAIEAKLRSKNYD